MYRSFLGSVVYEKDDRVCLNGTKCYVASASVPKITVKQILVLRAEDSFIEAVTTSDKVKPILRYSTIHK